MAKKRKRKPYVYDVERRRRAWERRLASFEGLVIKAAKGDAEPLLEYFRHGGPYQLSEEDGRWLAWLLERKLPRARHRPRGSSTPTNLAHQNAAYLLRFGKRRWCRKHHRQRASKSAIEKLAQRAVELVEQEFPSVRGRLTAENVRSFAKPIREAEVFASLDDFLLLAQAEMADAAEQ
jgi:hypothetical protein